MLFRDNNGKLIEIKGITFPKSQLEKDRIIDLIQKKN